jgi:hypothetical protein
MIAGIAGGYGAHVRALSITTSAADIVAIAGAAYTKLEDLVAPTELWRLFSALSDGLAMLRSMPEALRARPSREALADRRARPT